MGLTGRGEKPPPQLGHTSLRTSSTQRLQKVHSKLQIKRGSQLGAAATHAIFAANAWCGARSFIALLPRRRAQVSPRGAISKE